MVKLVGVYQGGTKSGTGECKARRYMPLEIEPDLTMVMELEEFCVACGSGSNAISNKIQSKTKISDDVEIFKRNYASLDKDELSAAVMVTWHDVLPSMAQTVSCVGCRRSIEHLFLSIKDSSKDCSLDPLVITKDGIISINKEHVQNPNSLSNLLCHQISRLQRKYLEGPASKKSGVKKGGRCALHLLEQKRGLSGCWLDCWDVMESECQDEVVLLPFSSIRATLDKYLKKHSFCCECATMINKAFTYLIEEGRDPALVDEHGDEIEYEGDELEDEEERNIVECEEKEDEEVVNEDGTLNLFSGVSPCVSDEHVHITRNPSFISQLLLLAEPELSGLDQERHAKNMETAQKEVLTCIGITLFNRFHKIQQRLREGEQTCDLLSLVALISLRKSFDICIERKRGILDLDALCYQIEQSDRDRERRQARKRERKTKNQQKKRDLKAVLEKEENKVTLDSCDQEKEWKENKSVSDKTRSKDDPPVAVVNNKVKDASNKGANGKKKPKEKKKGDKTSMNESGAKMKNADDISCSTVHNRCFRSHDQCGVEENEGADSDSGLSCVWSGDTSPLYVRSEGRYEQGTWIKGGSPDLGLGEGEGAKHHCTVSKQGPACNELSIRHSDMVMPSLEELLETDENSEEGMEEDAMFISAEEMKEFQSMFPQLNSQREQLRENLREKFAALCVNGRNIGGKICGKSEPRGN